MPSPLVIKPHHFLDIIRDFGAGVEHEPHPYGHAVHRVARILREDPDTLLQLTASHDSVCEPCRNLVNGHCLDTTDTTGQEISKESYNLMIDRRYFERLGLKEGDRLTALEFCRLTLKRLGDIYSIYQEVSIEKTARRERDLKRGLKEYLKKGTGGKD
ncbi:MAG TPA: DUF1284 domain-containing protein [archaeon]|nr:DUF1284 domain-containing protein [archaeon]